MVRLWGDVHISQSTNSDVGLSVRNCASCSMSVPCQFRFSTILLCAIFFVAVSCQDVAGDETHSFTYSSDEGTTIRLQCYNAALVRVQYARAGEDFFPDDHYGMVEEHRRTGVFQITDTDDHFTLTPVVDGRPSALAIHVDKETLRLSFSDTINDRLLTEQRAVRWDNTRITADFEADPAEHFCGLGHGSFGRVESIDLRGKHVNSNYGAGTGDDYGRQAILTVPFYMSNKGYGVFLNTTFRHDFNFGEGGEYQFSLDTRGFDGRMDYFFIYGPSFRDILNAYTELTGRPRLPQRSIFGWHLSDKGDPQHEGAEWWYEKVAAHREAGYPFDHVVFDNRWRAGSGAWSGSWFDWDSTRFPDPVAFGQWCDSSNLTLTLDLNRNICAASWGWDSTYNIPHATQFVKEGFSTPDYTNPVVRNWVWSLFWNKSLNPALGYPGDALWIDETDELYPLPDTIICENGRSWAENSNYYQFLAAKAIVGEGWDNSNDNNPPGIGDTKRPYVWMRGGTAGGQRFATHWTGDIKCEYTWMRANIRGMLASGLSGFPYFNHDAGGFRPPGPDDAMYIQWSLAFGSFSPIWRPHGPGENKRWPLDRSEACQEYARKYATLRYGLMPYIYTMAHRAHATGLPMARAMVIDYQNSPEAWKYDLQYLWGDAMLVAPATSGSDTALTIWLPPDQTWYEFSTGRLLPGTGVVRYYTRLGELPVFVKAGSIIPQCRFAPSTTAIDPSYLELHVYSGEDGEFVLVEDDGISGAFRTGAVRQTRIAYTQEEGALTIEAAKGSYEGATGIRSYHIYWYGLPERASVSRNNRVLPIYPTLDEAQKDAGIYWDSQGVAHVLSPRVKIDKELRFSWSDRDH